MIIHYVIHHECDFPEWWIHADLSFLCRLTQVDLYGSVRIKEQLPECGLWAQDAGRVLLTAAAGCLQGEAVQGRKDAPAKVAAAEGPGSVHQGAALAEKARVWR